MIEPEIGDLIYHVMNGRHGIVISNEQEDHHKYKYIRVIYNDKTAAVYTVWQIDSYIHDGIVKYYPAIKNNG